MMHDIGEAVAEEYYSTNQLTKQRLARLINAAIDNANQHPEKNKFWANDVFPEKEVGDGVALMNIPHPPQKCDHSNINENNVCDDCGSGPFKDEN